MRLSRAVMIASMFMLAACASPRPGGAIAPPRPGDRRAAPEEPSDLVELAAAWRAYAPSYEDPRLTAYVEEVGARVAQRSERPSLDWTFRVLDSAEVNAYSLADRHVAVTRGLLAHMESEAELAAVLAHEVSHVVCQHTTRPAFEAQLPDWLESEQPGLSALSPLDEHQADQMAARILTRTEYAPRAVFEALRSLRRVPSAEIAPTDDDASSDLAAADDLLVRTARAALFSANLPDGQWGRSRYLSAIEGLMVGSGSEDAAIRGGRYVDPPNKLAIDLPPGVEAKLAFQLLTLTQPTSGAMVLLMPATRRHTAPGSEIAEMLTDVVVRSVRGITVREGNFGGLEAGTGRLAILELEDARFMLLSGGKTQRAIASSRELHHAVLSGLSRRVGLPPPVARLRIVAADRGPPSSEDRASCPAGTDLALSAALNDESSSARRRGRARVKCAVRDSLGR